MTGFAIHERVIPTSDLAALIVPARSPAGARHLMHTPAVASFARRPELVALAREWLRRDAVPFFVETAPLPALFHLR